MRRILALICSGKYDGIGPAAISRNGVDNLSGGFYSETSVGNPDADGRLTRDKSETTPFKKIISDSAYALYQCTPGEL